MAKINLLPSESTPKTNVQNFASTLKSFSIVGLILVVITSLLLTIGIVYYLVSISLVNSDNKKRSDNISTLEQTEQRFVLLKDRISKANEIYQKDTGQSKIDSLTAVINSKPADASITELLIDQDRWSLTFTTTNSQSLVSFMSQIMTNSKSNNINLGSFTLTGAGLYTVTLVIFI